MSKELVVTRPKKACWTWKPTSSWQLKEAEQKILKVVECPFEQQTVTAEGTQINSIKAGKGSDMVLLHGMCAGIGFWAANIATFAKHFTVYAMDLPGAGRSERPPLPGKTAAVCEDFFVSRVEAYRKAQGIEKMVLLGHSFGGYVAGSYALRYPQHVRHLVLLDPWGIPQNPSRPFILPWYAKAIMWMSKAMDGLAGTALVRTAGPLGPHLVAKARGDITEKWAPYIEDREGIEQYMYHCNAGHPTAEMAFQCLIDEDREDHPLWPKNPLEDRFKELHPDMPVTFIYGSHTWMDSSAGKRVSAALGTRASYHVVPNAGHHVYIDNAQVFHSKVLDSVLETFTEAEIIDGR